MSINSQSAPPLQASQQVSVYIPMQDGVKIAVDIWLPDDFVSGNKVPIAVEFTRYWRAAEGVKPKERVRIFAQAGGVASAIADCRGSGASFGRREVENSGAEAADFATVIEWLANQPWSNGSVVSIGTSYSANTAELALFDAPSALKAAIVRFSDFDTYVNISFPGGLLNRGLLKPWGEGIRAMDLNETKALGPLWEGFRNQRIKPVDGDRDKHLLAQAINEHQNNVPLIEYLADIEFRDDFNCADNLNHSDRPVSPHLIHTNQRVKEVPSYHWASFNDAGTAAGAIARFLGSTAPMRVVIGYWNHGSDLDANPFESIGLDATPIIESQYLNQAEYIKALCSDSQNTEYSHLATERALYYYTAGKNVWRKTEVWPPTGISTQRWFLNENHRVSLESPNGNTGKDTYRVDFNAGTGLYTRWNQIDNKVHYGDRAEPDKKCLTYISAPLEQAVEITGHPVVTLQLSSTQTDGVVIVYLEAVAPDGSVTMLTEGCLRLIHRKVSDETPPYPHFGPYHTFERKDLLPMPVGEVVEVGFECLPLSVQIPKGNALRVAIAGHDKDCFDRLPEAGEVTLNLYRTQCMPSFIELPIRYLDDQVLSDNDQSMDPFHI